MPTRDADQLPDGQRPEALHALIAGQVVRALGTPTVPFRVQVRPLWGHSYRVNVLLGPELFSAGVAHSYFVRIDAGGAVIDADPRIVRQYGAPCV